MNNQSFPDDLPADEMGDYLRLYLDETNEQLDSLVEIFLQLENKPPTPDDLNEAFRLIHSIKGSSALLGLDRITSLTHHLETHFERLRSGKQELNTPTIDIVLRCIDFLRESNQHLQDGEPIETAGDLLDQVKLLGQITPSLEKQETQKKEHTQQTEDDQENTRSVTEQLPEPSIQETEEPWWKISISKDHDNPSPAHAALAVFQSLASLGELIASQPHQESLENDSDFTHFVLLLKTFAPESEIIQTIQANNFTIFSVEQVPTGTTLPTTEIQITNDSSQQAAHDPSPATHTKTAALAKTVRVDVDRLDVLLNLAGELVVNRARLTQLAENVAPAFHKLGLSAHTTNLLEAFRKLTARVAEQLGEKVDHELQDLNEQVDKVQEQLQDWEHNRQSFSELSTAIDQLTRVSNSLQRGVLNTRMVPVGPLFNRFKRSIRDITQELGKQVNLEIEGEKTELDKRMIDEIGDPLNHLIRNCVDHGIESADMRIQKGKPKVATVSLAASHRGNNVFITVEDDGRGIDMSRVKQTAITRGVISQGSADQLSEDEVAELIFQPGFSTAEEISDISGRGVGMDIVRTKIAQLNGTVEVSSKAGVGTKFIIRLPLTLTITRCMLFRLSHGVLAVPIENVREIVSVSGFQSTTANGRQMCDVRGEFLPLVSIDDLFDFHVLTGSDGKELRKQALDSDNHVVILHAANKSLGLRVDGLLGGQDIVVKSLDENFKHIKGLGGASILGDGSVCLLLDAATCIELAAMAADDLSKEMIAE